MTPIRIIVGLIILGILAVGITLFIRGGATDPSETTDPTQVEMRVYENQVHGFSLSYPGNLEVREYGVNDVTFGTIDGEAIDGVADARVMTVEGETTETMIDAIADELQTLCAADGPSMTFSCTGVDQMQPFTTTSGESGYVLYLRGELHDFTSNKTAVMGKGPYFVLPLATGATGNKALVIHPPLNQYAEEAASTTIRMIAESVEIAESQGEDPVAAYIRDNISEISPVDEVLGGTFYVTDLEAYNGTGVVSYEDGHIALTADFTYTVNANGDVTINTFTVREQE